MNKEIKKIQNDRYSDYGSAEDTLESIATFWQEYLRRKTHSDLTIDKSDVAIMMSLVKTTRYAFKRDQDTVLDLAAYADFALQFHKKKITEPNETVNDISEKTKELKLPYRSLLNAERVYANFDSAFEVIWNPDIFPWDRDSGALAMYYNQQFDKWWNPDKYNWEDFSEVLAMYCSDYFDKWWNPDKYNWEEFSGSLSVHCSDYFNTWWDPDKYNWRNCSGVLAKYCSDYFHTWWNPEEYNWKDFSEELATYCSAHFEDWWDPDKYNFETASESLITKCGDFSKMWNKYYNEYHLGTNNVK